mgnify:CR=1 FL=1
MEQLAQVRAERLHADALLALHRIQPDTTSEATAYEETLFTFSDPDRLEKLGRWNRAYFEQSVLRQLSMCRRYRQPLGCVLADIDLIGRAIGRYDKAIADYERTRMSGNSAWDKWRRNKDEAAARAVSGAALSMAILGQRRGVHRGRPGLRQFAPPGRGLPRCGAGGGHRRARHVHRARNG